MKKFFLIGATLLLSLYASAQHVALKNNIVYDATATPNLGLEVGLGKKVTMDLSAGYNPFEFNNDKQAKHWLAHAGVRFWTCEKFNGTFIGVHALGGQYDVAGFQAAVRHVQETARPSLRRLYVWRRYQYRTSMDSGANAGVLKAR